MTTVPQDNNRNGEFLRQRLYSLDAYRGLIMLTLAFAGFGLAKTAVNMQQHVSASVDLSESAKEQQTSVWKEVERQFTHAKWVGCSYWDMIQPSFMFMVGVSMAYSYLKREQMGHSYFRMLLHALWRSLVLILLGVFLSSTSRQYTSTNWSFMNVLSQIGLGYPFLFLCRGSKAHLQVIVALALLLGTWCLYNFHSTEGIDLEGGSPAVGVDKEFAQRELKNLPPAWHKNANIGHSLDVELLNSLPRPADNEFRFNSGGYQTINFVASLATMIFGLVCGELLRSPDRSTRFKLLALLIMGGIGVGSGWALDHFGICPLVKRIWTPSFALFSGGICIWTLLVLFTIIDVIRFRFWAIPLVVVGVNSIAIYLMSQLLKPWTATMLKKHLGPDLFQLKLQFGDRVYTYFDEATQAKIDLFEPTIHYCMVGLIFWLVCLYLYRHKIFIRI